MWNSSIRTNTNLESPLLRGSVEMLLLQDFLNVGRATELPLGSSILNAPSCITCHSLHDVTWSSRVQRWEECHWTPSSRLTLTVMTLLNSSCTSCVCHATLQYFTLNFRFLPAFSSYFPACVYMTREGNLFQLHCDCGFEHSVFHELLFLPAFLNEITSFSAHNNLLFFFS